MVSWSYVTGGAVLMLLSIFFTIFTLGFGIICTGPLFLIGFIIFIAGFFIKESKKNDTQVYNITQQTSSYPSSVDSNKNSGRYCPNCGRSIPFEAALCPYCGLKFKTFTDESSSTDVSCPECGSKNPKDATYCSSCGSKI
ncbi:MAG: zinc ribbon domain-containing protein [Candidatus Thermoplasmatota archaeon]